MCLLTLGCTLGACFKITLVHIHVKNPPSPFFFFCPMHPTAPWIPTLNTARLALCRPCYARASPYYLSSHLCSWHILSPSSPRSLFPLTCLLSTLPCPIDPTSFTQAHYLFLVPLSLSKVLIFIQSSHLFPYVSPCATSPLSTFPSCCLPPCSCLILLDLFPFNPFAHSPLCPQASHFPIYTPLSSPLLFTQSPVPFIPALPYSLFSTPASPVI